MTDGRSDGGDSDRGAECARHAREARPDLLAELWELVSTNKKWSLTPIVVVIFWSAG